MRRHLSHANSFVLPFGTTKVRLSEAIFTSFVRASCPHLHISHDGVLQSLLILTIMTFNIYKNKSNQAFSNMSSFNNFSLLYLTVHLVCLTMRLTCNSLKLLRWIRNNLLLFSWWLKIKILIQIFFWL
jgi:hypothetical protein